MSLGGSIGLLLLLLSMAVIPGPSDLLVAGIAMRRGYQSAVHATLGILFADLILIIAVVYGARMIVESLTTYEHWLRYASSGMLILIGLWMIRIRVAGTRMDSNAALKQ